MTDRLALDKSGQCSRRPVRSSLSLPAAESVALVSTSADWSTPLETAGRTTSTLRSSAEDSWDRSAQKPSGCWPGSRGRKDDGSSSGQSGRHTPAWPTGLTRLCLSHMTRWISIRHLSLCIEGPALASNDFQLDYSTSYFF
jgi:hypothetical protein